MSTEHFYGEVTQKALIVHEGRILLVRSTDTDPRAAGKWDMPGGRLHDGESPREGLEREVREEIGAEVSIGPLLATDVFTNLSDKKNYLVVFKASLVDPAIAFVLPDDEIAEVRWFSPSEVASVPFLYPTHRRAALGHFR